MGFFAAVAFSLLLGLVLLPPGRRSYAIIAGAVLTASLWFYKG